jgi:hypothetical protein
MNMLNQFLINFLTFSEVKKITTKNSTFIMMSFFKWVVFILVFIPVIEIFNYKSIGIEELSFDILLSILKVSIVILVAKVTFNLYQEKFSWALFLDVIFAIVWRLVITISILGFIAVNFTFIFSGLVHSSVLSNFSSETIAFEMMALSFLVFLIPLVIKNSLSK